MARLGRPRGVLLLGLAERWLAVEGRVRFALRGDRYKFIYYHGVWDLEELYDIRADPEERTNLAEAMPELAAEMRGRLFDRLAEDDAMRVPLRRGNWNADERLLLPD